MTVENLRKHFSGSGGKGDKWRYYGRALRASTKLYYYVLINVVSPLAPVGA